MKEQEEHIHRLQLGRDFATLQVIREGNWIAIYVAGSEGMDSILQNPHYLEWRDSILRPLFELQHLGIVLVNTASGDRIVKRMPTNFGNS